MGARVPRLSRSSYILDLGLRFPKEKVQKLGVPILRIQVCSGYIRGTPVLENAMSMTGIHIEQSAPVVESDKMQSRLRRCSLFDRYSKRFGMVHIDYETQKRRWVSSCTETVVSRLSV